MEFVKLPPCGSAKSHSEGIVTFDIGVQSFQCFAKRLSPHLAEFFSSTVGRPLEILEFKKNLAKNLELKTATINEPRVDKVELRTQGTFSK